MTRSEGRRRPPRPSRPCRRERRPVPPQADRRKANRSRKGLLPDGRTVPDLNEEYFLYQTFVGSWPFDFNNEQGRANYTERIKQYMTKAVHEAKVNLSWINDDPVYVEQLQQFIVPIQGVQVE